MDALRRRVLIAILWVIYAMGMSVYMCLSLVRPEILQGIAMVGKFEELRISGGLLLLFEIYWLVPWILAVLTMTLKERAVRRMNLVMGVILSLIFIPGGIIQIVRGQPAAMVAVYVFGIAESAFVVWNARLMPKQPEEATA